MITLSLAIYLTIYTQLSTMMQRVYIFSILIIIQPRELLNSHSSYSSLSLSLYASSFIRVRITFCPQKGQYCMLRSAQCIVVFSHFDSAFAFIIPTSAEISSSFTHILHCVQFILLWNVVV